MCICICIRIAERRDSGDAFEAERESTRQRFIHHHQQMFTVFNQNNVCCTLYNCNQHNVLYIMKFVYYFIYCT